MKIVFVINSLQLGGAENYMLGLASHFSDKFNAEVVIVTLRDGGILSQVAKDNFRVHSLNLTKFNALWKMRFLRDLIKQEKPDVVSLWLYHSVFIGLLSLLGLSVKKIVNIRQERINLNSNKFSTFMVYLSSVLLLPTAKLILGNSRNFVSGHPLLNFFKTKCDVVPNGVAPTFCSRPIKRITRRNLSVGIVGRIDPEKNISEIFEALRIAKLEHVELKVVGPDARSNGVLKRLLKCYPKQKVKLINGDEPGPNLYDGIDILVSCSRGEGFSNVIAEATSLGIFCVITDVGMAREIVIASQSRIYQPGNIYVLASILAELYENGLVQNSVDVQEYRAEWNAIRFYKMHMEAYVAASGS